MTNGITRWMAAVAAVLALPAWAQAGDIVDTAYVQNALKNGAIVWDVRDADAYQAGHIPGAVNVGDIGRVLRDPHREDWLPDAQVEKVLGNAGIDIANKEVIVYSAKADPYAYFGLSTVRYFGGKAGKVYHGGLDDWKAARLPVATEPTRLPAVALKLAPQKDVVVWTDEVVRKLPDAKAGKVQIVDVRTAGEFAGTDIRAIRGGHIPGAVNVPYEQNWVDPATSGKLARKEVSTRDGMALKPVADLRKLYAGLDPDKETIVYCQSGVRGAVGGDRPARARLQGREDLRAVVAGLRGHAVRAGGERGVRQHRRAERPHRGPAKPRRRAGGAGRGVAEEASLSLASGRPRRRRALGAGQVRQSAPVGVARPPLDRAPSAACRADGRCQSRDPVMGTSARAAATSSRRRVASASAVLPCARSALRKPASDHALSG